MTIPRSTAKKLSTEVEYRLINESFAPLVGGLSEKGLAQRIRRTRVARDKYRSLSERQAREARGRISPRGTRAAAGNKNTVVKQKLFEETLARYEKQAARADGATDRKGVTRAAAGQGKANGATRRTAASASGTSRSGTAAAKVKTSSAATKSAGKKTAGKKAVAGKKTGRQSAKAAAAPAASTRRSTNGKAVALTPAAKAGKAAKTTSTGARSRSATAARPATSSGKRSGSGRQAKAATVAATAAKPAARGSSRAQGIKAVAKDSAAKGDSVSAATRSKPVAKAGTKPPAKSASKSTANGAKKKVSSRTSSRTGTLTKPVKIPPLQQVLSAVHDAVAARKESGPQAAAPVPPPRSPKAPAITNDGAPPGTPAGAASAEHSLASDLPSAPPVHAGTRSARKQPARSPGR